MQSQGSIRMLRVSILGSGISFFRISQLSRHILDGLNKNVYSSDSSILNLIGCKIQCKDVESLSDIMGVCQ